MESLVLDRINKEMIWELEKARLNVSHLWILELFYDNKEVAEEVIDELSRTSAYCTLQRKGYIENDKISEDGKILYELIVSLNTGGEEALQATVKKLTTDRSAEREKLITGFEEWWLAYPTTDRIVDINGVMLKKETRAMRIGKEYCRDKYEKLIAEGYKHEDLMKALKYEVEMRRQKSERGAENQMTFMHNSKTYLYQRSFEAFIELAKEEKPTNMDDKFNV